MLVNIEYDRYNPEILYCKVVSSRKDMGRFINILGDRSLEPRIVGKVGNEEGIYIYYAGYSTSNNEAEVNIHTIGAISSFKRKKINYLKEFKYNLLFHQVELKKGLLRKLVNAYRN